MSSGRSARLPPTPITASNVVRHVVDVSTLHHHTAYNSSQHQSPASTVVVGHQTIHTGGAYVSGVVGGSGMSGSGGVSGGGGVGMVGGNGVGVVGGSVGGVGVGGGGGGGVGGGYVGGVMMVDTGGVRSAVGSARNSAASSRDALNALGPELAMATSQVLDSLSDRERQIILDVLNRDEQVRQRDAARIM